MPSQWYCFTDEESGPFTFQQLADMIARGELLDADLVRRKEATQWQRVDAVLGLNRAAARIRENVSSRRHEHEKSRSQTPARLFSKTPLQPSTAGLVIGLGGICLAGLLLQLGWLWWQRIPRFPPAPAGGVVIRGTSRLQQVRPPPPARPTFPELLPATPVIVPGFESIPWLKSPSLSDDLLSVVYVTYTGTSGLDDLMIAERSSRTAAFVNHRPLQLVNSPSREAHPSLSPDGSELLFCRLESPARLWIARRSEASGPFGPPVPVKFLNGPPAEHALDAPQFMDANTIHFTSGDTQFQGRRHWLARRQSAAEFRVEEELDFSDPWPRYFVRRQRRAYLAAPSGLKVTAFAPAIRQFVEPETWLESTVVGGELTSHDDTVWVTPAEDVIFYCGPGPGDADPQSRRLWMVRP